MVMSNRPPILDQHEAFLLSLQNRSEGDVSEEDVSDEDAGPPVPKPFFPPAITIRSHQPSTLLLNTQDPSLPDHSIRSVEIIPKHVEWREWNINPSHHGPERVKGPPIFVPSKGDYDDLGRSLIHGNQVDVDLGYIKKKGLENGESVAGWYTSLSRSGQNTPDESEEVVENESIPHLVEPIKVSKEDAIDLTGDSDEEPVSGLGTITDSKTRQQSRDLGDSASPIPDVLNVSPTVRPDWFNRHKPPSQTPTARKPKQSSSIGSLLGTGFIEPKSMKSLPKYELGPENKGYEILKERLGWTGGGFGKPIVSITSEPQSQSPSQSQSQSQSLSQSQPQSTRDIIHKAQLPDPDAGVEAVQKGIDLKDPIDLTLSEESESESDYGIDSESEMESTPPPDIQTGPGRTIPISTSLKLDKFGLGHRGNLRDKAGNLLKRVTHTHDHIELAKKRGKKSISDHQLELGKKGKIKWKEKDRKERDERRRLAAYIDR